MTEIGDRVGAVLSAKDNVVQFLGYGTYQGEQPCDLESGFCIPGIPNPKIELDNGKVVWGGECWWGPADKIVERFEGWEFQEVDIDEARKEAQQ